LGVSEFADKCWLWCHAAGSHNGWWNLPGESRISPADAADYMRIPNAVMVVFGDTPAPPFMPHAAEMAGLKRLVWSVIGDAGSKRNETSPDLDAVLAMAESCPNLTGAIMDDLFNASGDGKLMSRCSVQQLSELQSRLRGASRPLELWSVLYEHDLSLPVQEYLRYCDVVTYWTWHARDLPRLAEGFARVEEVLPCQRKMLGCYMWDYGDSRSMPLETMRQQCALGRSWLAEGRIDGIIFLASCICDLGLETVEWTRRWIAEQTR
jgi:hypothetical protein